MPKLTADGHSSEMPEGRRLVLAIEDSGVHIGHRCGGNARCNTCRVRFDSGEPESMTKAEYTWFKERDLFGQYRLSCQIVCDHAMSVRPALTLENQPWTDSGPTPDPEVHPEAVWYPKTELEG